MAGTTDCIPILKRVVENYIVGCMPNLKDLINQIHEESDI